MTTAHQPPTNHLIIMYHYVWPDDRMPPGGIRPLKAAEFAVQLQWLAERYDLVGADQFLSRLREPDWRQRPACLLTFDDGTRDHATVVTPLLQERGLSGVFFVLSGPIEDRRMPLTHAVHWLLGQDEKVVWEMLVRMAQERLGGIEALGEESAARQIYHYETELRARIKYAANIALPAPVMEEFMDRAIQSAGLSHAELAGKWFVNAEDVKRMHAAGMTIGMHGVTHRSLQSLGAEGIRDEIASASHRLAQLTGQRPAWFACPFGGSGADSQTTAAMYAAMDAAGIAAAVTTRKELVRPGCNPLQLPRFDCIDLPPRRHQPLFGEP